MGKRRGKGEGSLFQRKDGTWVAEITNGYDDKGKRKTITRYGRTKREAQDKLTIVKTELLHGTLCEPQRLTVAQYLEQWVEGRISLHKTTLVDYKGVIRNHLNPHLGGIKLDKLTPMHVQRMLNEMKRNGASQQILKKTYTILHGALAQAARWRIVPRNVCAEVEKPKAENKTFVCFNAEEAKRFLETAKSERLYALYLMAIATGLRQGELFALRWSNIDEQAKCITVTHTLIEIGGRLELGEPKSDKSRRIVALPDWAVEELKAHRDRMTAEGLTTEWVFCDTDGKPLRKSNVRRRSYIPLVKRAEVPLIRFHDLRHTSATLMVESGTGAKVVSDRMGHSTIGMTMGTYVHVSRSLDQEAADRLGALLR